MARGGREPRQESSCSSLCRGVPAAFGPLCLQDGPSKQDPETPRRGRAGATAREVGSQRPLRLWRQRRPCPPQPHSDSSLGPGRCPRPAGAHVEADPFGGAWAFQKDRSPASHLHEPAQPPGREPTGAPGKGPGGYKCGRVARGHRRGPWPLRPRPRHCHRRTLTPESQGTVTWQETSSFRFFPNRLKILKKKKILAPEMYENRDSRDVDRGPQIAGLSSWSLRFSLKLSVPSVRHRTRDHRAPRGTGPNARKPRERKTRRRRRSREMSGRRRAQGPALRSP